MTNTTTHAPAMIHTIGHEPRDNAVSRGPSVATFYVAVRGFKRQVIERHLQEHGGNRTRAARALGLPRTYLLRLIRDLGVTTPAPARGRYRSGEL